MSVLVRGRSGLSRRLRPALLALAAMAWAWPARADVYRVGVGSGCTHATVQAAVDDAALTSETDTILVANNITYSTQDITIVDQNLTMLGGYPNCLTFFPNGRTELDGAGGAAEPVVKITGGGIVTIEQINLTGGDESSLGLGGGLFFEGSGGGIEAVSIRLTMTSPGSAVFFNTATGFTFDGDFFEGDGGGIHCVDCLAYIGTATAAGTLFLNTAYGHGGAVAVHGRDADATVHLFTKVATQPTVLWGNVAGISGGAIHTQSTHDAVPLFADGFE